MGLLHEIAVRAKWDGAYTLEWAKLRSFIPNEPKLQDVPGRTDIQKLQAWAERQGLLMDFDLELVGFTTEIRTVTFSNPATQQWTSQSLPNAPTA